MKLKAIVKRILFIYDTLSTVPLHLTLGMQSVVFLTTWPDNQYCVLRAVLEKGGLGADLTTSFSTGAPTKEIVAAESYWCRS